MSNVERTTLPQFMMEWIQTKGIGFITRGRYDDGILVGTLHRLTLVELLHEVVLKVLWAFADCVSSASGALTGGVLMVDSSTVLNRAVVMQASSIFMGINVLAIIAMP